MMLVNDPDRIEECIQKVRIRLTYGQTPAEIAEELKDDFMQEIIFLSVEAANILDKAANMSND